MDSKTEGKKGKVVVVGLGPGALSQMTGEAFETLKESDVIAGYNVYVELVKNHFPEKKLITTGMRREEDRCLLALQAAEAGAQVALVCSGDAGVYGLAGLIYEMGQAFCGVEIRVIPGVTAAQSGAARLGAPLIHDFAVISLSDLLTPWEMIAKRLRMAAEGDFAIVLYNPASRKRPDYLKRACDILLEILPPDQVCGTVRNIGREGETTRLYSLRDLREAQVDMFTTVFIGKRSTRRIGEHMVTPRGYSLEQEHGIKDGPADRGAYGDAAGL